MFFISSDDVTPQETFKIENFPGWYNFVRLKLEDIVASVEENERVDEESETD